MRRIQVSFDAPKVEINGQVFELKKSDADILAEGQAILKRCAMVKITDAENVRAATEDICRRIDGILGEGAMMKLAGNQSISINTALKLMNAITSDCTERYQKYIEREYLRTERSEKRT